MQFQIISCWNIFFYKKRIVLPPPHPEKWHIPFCFSFEKHSNPINETIPIERNKCITFSAALLPFSPHFLSISKQALHWPALDTKVSSVMMFWCCPPILANIVQYGLLVLTCNIGYVLSGFRPPIQPSTFQIWYCMCIFLICHQSVNRHFSIDCWIDQCWRVSVHFSVKEYVFYCI